MASPEAERIHRNSIVVEAHRDMFKMVRLKNMGERYPVINTMLPRLKKGGVDVTFFAICGDAVSHSKGTYRYLSAALENIDALRQEAEAANGKIKIILNADDIPSAPSLDTHYFLLSFEGGKHLGLRAMQITWNLRNDLADGIKEEETRGGLTRFGVSVVKEMNRLGMLIDLAHISRAGYFHVLDVADGPVCCSHSNCRKLNLHPRTIDDEQIKALAQTGGVIGINAISTQVAEKNATLDKLVDHISYMADLVGTEHVGLGLDFVKNDGALHPDDELFNSGENKLLPELENEEDLLNLTDRLLKRGFQEIEITKILGGNFLRVLKHVLKARGQ
ncbi:MAG: membrane dipeptidase [Deltaproteobacteria bacterium]|nr:membrane dipeptidase [Deltaproteobacteria bacterium]